jgi:hypothetical protein
MKTYFDYLFHMTKIKQIQITMPMCEKLELIIKDRDWINPDGSISFPCCNNHCGEEAIYNTERLKELNIDINCNKSLAHLSLSHYQTCKRLKSYLEDAESFYSKTWNKIENNKIDLTLNERTCYDCGKVYKDKKSLKRHTEQRDGCSYKINSKIQGTKIGVYNFWETMHDDISMIRGLGSDEERIQLYVPNVSMNNMKQKGGNNKWAIAYDYDMLEGGRTIKTRYIVSKFDGRIAGIDNEQYKIYPNDFCDEQQNEDISNWEVSPNELRRLKNKNSYYMDGAWVF